MKIIVVVTCSNIFRFALFFITLIRCKVLGFFVPSHDLNFEELCFVEALHGTQSCTNKNILYVTTLGCCQSGFGSEFNLYLISSLLTAVATNRRMVYYQFKRTWEYDCQSESGWACYLSFPCEENGVTEEQLDYSQAYLGVNRITDKTLWRPNMTHIRRLSPRHKDVYESINIHSVGSHKCNVTFTSLPVTTLTSLAARYLYRLNAPTVAAVNLNFHTKFKNAF